MDVRNLLGTKNGKDYVSVVLNYKHDYRLALISLVEGTGALFISVPSRKDNPTFVAWLTRKMRNFDNVTSCIYESGWEKHVDG